MSDTAGTGPHMGPDEKADRASLGNLLGEVTRDMSTLMRQELDLAKAELRETAKNAAAGSGMYAGAAVAAHFTLAFLSLALWWGLGDLMGNLGWSAVIVALIWAIIAAVLAAIGRNRMKSIKGMPQTAASVKKIPDALKPEEPR